MKKPVKAFRAGTIQAAIWENSNEKGPYRTVTFQKRFKAGEEWKSTNTLMMNEIPKAILVLSKAFDELALGNDDGVESPSSYEQSHK